MNMQYTKCNVPKQIKLDALVTFHDSIYKSDFCYEGEMHDFWEIVCIISGKVEIVAGGNVVSLQRGQAVLHPPMEFHNLRPEGGAPAEALIVTFYADCMPDLPRRIFKIAQGTAEQLQRLCRQAKTIFTFEKSPGQPTSVIGGKEFEASMFFTLLEYYIHCLILDKAELSSLNRTQSAESYMNILNVMEQNLDKKLSICELAALCSMGEASLRSIFHKYSGKGVMSYFNLMKIKRAMFYLQEGNSVKETAHKLGFFDQNYFSTVFKRITGVPPKKFKVQ